MMNDARMPKVRTTLMLDKDVLQAAKVRGARTGVSESEVIEDALRRELGLNLFDSLGKQNDLREKEATHLAVEAQHATRRRT
jgi:hypothetical protein